MNRSLLLVLISALLLLSVLFVACTNVNISDKEQISVKDLVYYVSEAAEYSKTVGEPEDLIVLSTLNGRFTRGDLYVYAYDFNGTLLAHPYLTEEIGTNRLGWTDDKGLPVIKVGNYIAKLGGGYIAYMYPAPEGGAIDEAAIDSYVPKIGYVLPVDEKWWIGSGIYISDLDDIHVKNVISKLTRYHQER